MSLAPLLRQVAQFTAEDTGLPQASATGFELQQILEVVFIITGSIATLIIVIAGITYILSGGDPQKTNKAKDTILYAVIGVVISVSAWAIVSFALEEIF